MARLTCLAAVLRDRRPVPFYRHPGHLNTLAVQYADRKTTITVICQRELRRDDLGIFSRVLERSELLSDLIRVGPNAR